MGDTPDTPESQKPVPYKGRKKTYIYDGKIPITEENIQKSLKASVQHQGRYTAIYKDYKIFPAGPLAGVHCLVVDAALWSGQVPGVAAETSFADYKREYLKSEKGREDPRNVRGRTANQSKHIDVVYTKDMLDESMEASALVSDDNQYPTIGEKFTAGPLEGWRCQVLDKAMAAGNVEGFAAGSSYAAYRRQRSEETDRAKAKPAAKPAIREPKTREKKVKLLKRDFYEVAKIRPLITAFLEAGHYPEDLMDNTAILYQDDNLTLTVRDVTHAFLNDAVRGLEKGEIHYSTYRYAKRTGLFPGEETLERFGPKDP